MTLTRSDREGLDEEVSQAIENHAENIDQSNCDRIFIYKVTRRKIKWSINCCTQCRKPFLLHENPWVEECGVEPIKQDLKGELIEKLENHARVKQIAKSMEPDSENEDSEDEDDRPRTPRYTRTRTRTRTERGENSQNKCKFPLWKEKTQWSEYETMISWHRKTSKKDPENQFMDLVNA